MTDAVFHFEQPLWLLALLLPLVIYAWLRFTAPRHNTERYRAYADAHLLPFLLAIRESGSVHDFSKFLRWTLLWTILTIAMAGPRWDYEDIQLFRPGNDLLILLDLSQSMNSTDVSPTRLVRARQEIEDLLTENRSARVGLVAFATLAHVVAPLTEDGYSLRSLLPAISTDLVKLKGSRLLEALVRARQLLAGQPEDSAKHILLITDGDFGDEGHDEVIRQLASEDVKIHVLGIGTPDGAEVEDSSGRKLRSRQGEGVVSRLDEASLKVIAEKGNGIYRRASYDDDDTQDILGVVSKHTGAAKVTEEKTRVWNERFYWLVAIVMLSLLPAFRWVIAPSASRERDS